MAEKKLGRPKSGHEVRGTQVSFFLTEEDAKWFSEFAVDVGFANRGEFFTAVAERLRLGGLAPFAWLRLGWLIKRRAEEAGVSKDAGWWNPLQRWPELPGAGRPPRPVEKLPDEPLPKSQEKTVDLVTKEFVKTKPA